MNINRSIKTLVYYYCRYAIYEVWRGFERYSRVLSGTRRFRAYRQVHKPFYISNSIYHPCVESIKRMSLNKGIGWWIKNNLKYAYHTRNGDQNDSSEDTEYDMRFSSQVGMSCFVKLYHDQTSNDVHKWRIWKYR